MSPLKINFMSQRTGQTLYRVVFCVIIWGIFYFTTIDFLTPEPATFSLKSGELKCDTMPECVDAAKANAIKKWKNQRQILEYTERWSQFVGLSILPLRYKIGFDNRSYNQIETTGPMGEKRQFPASVTCGDPFVLGIGQNSSVKIEDNLEWLC